MRPLSLTVATLATTLAARADAQPRAASPMRLVGVAAHGPLRADAVRSGLQRARDALLTCPMDGIRGRNLLRVAVLIDASGRALRVRVLGDDGVPLATSRCFAGRLGETSFQSSTTNEVTAVEARWTFTARTPGAPRPAMLGEFVSASSPGAPPSPPASPTPPPPRANPPVRTGQATVLSVETDAPEAATPLRAQVSRDAAALRGCYNVRLNTWGPAEGTLVFALTLSAGAQRRSVVSATRLGGTLTDAEPATCLLGWFRRQVYEAAPAATRATITLRFTMD